MIDNGGSARQPLFSIQVLRALAALTVIWQHIQYDFRVKIGVANFPPSINIINSGVDIFFVISGFIIVYSSASLFQRPGAWKEFIVRRVIRIVPLYWVMSLVALGYILVRHQAIDIYPADVFRKWVISSFLFIPYPRTNGEMAPLIGVGWTLNYEMFFYALFAAALCLSRRIAVVGITVLLVVLVLADSYFALPLNPSLAFWCNPRILEFAFGMLIASALLRGIHIPTWLTWALILGGIGASSLVEYFGYFGLNTGAHAKQLTVIEWGIPAALIVTGLSLNNSRSHAHPLGFVAQFFSFLGDASYSIYLVHPFSITIVRFIYFGSQNGMSLPQQPSWLYVALQFLFAVAAGALAHVAIEKPLTNFCRGFIRQTKIQKILVTRKSEQIST